MASVKYTLERASLFGKPTGQQRFVIITSMDDTETTLVGVTSLEEAIKRIRYEIFGDLNEEDPYTKKVSFAVIDKTKNLLYRYNKSNNMLLCST